jgi:uncharacterized OB-fold protein
MDANFIQKRMDEIQSSDEFSDVFSKLVSGGRAGYKAVIEKKPIIIKCKNCQTILDPIEKFCHECGAKVEKD